MVPAFVPADNNTISELSSLHDDDSNFRQSYHQMRNKQFPMSGDLESNPDYWSGVMGLLVAYILGMSRAGVCKQYLLGTGIYITISVFFLNKVLLVHSQANLLTYVL